MECPQLVGSDLLSEVKKFKYLEVFFGMSEGKMLCETVGIGLDCCGEEGTVQKLNLLIYQLNYIRAGLG